jgi:hypothetical protein
MKKLLKSLALFVSCLFITLCFQATTYAFHAGWEAVDQYNGIAPNLSQCVNEALLFENEITLRGSGMWSTSFGWANNNAWEEDFKTQELGGTDYLNADDVDLMLFSGHGNTNGFNFGTYNDDPQLHWSEADWGDQDLEWIIIDACNVLNFDDWNVFTKWGWPVFKGLHYIFGYSSTNFDVNTRGRDFIKYATLYGWTLRDAWWAATTLSESGTTAAYLRAEDTTIPTDTWNDHLWGFGYVSPDPVNPNMIYYTTWTT